MLTHLEKTCSVFVLPIHSFEQERTAYLNGVVMEKRSQGIVEVTKRFEDETMAMFAAALADKSLSAVKSGPCLG